MRRIMHSLFLLLTFSVALANVSMPASAATPDAIPEQGISTGKLYALVVGVKTYKDSIIKERYPLKFADKDAAEFAEALKLQKGKIYTDVIVHTLTNEQATRGDIATELAWLTDTPERTDVSILFMSGHGQNRQKNNTGPLTSEYYFFPHETDFKNDKVPATALSYAEIVKYITNGRAKKLVFLDTCHSGQMGEQDATGMVNSLTRDGEGRRVAVFASSTGNQESIELPSKQHGAFTQAILEALYGKETAPAMFEGAITVKAMSLWLERRVPKLVREADPNRVQKPSTVDLTGEELTFAKFLAQ